MYSIHTRTSYRVLTTAKTSRSRRRVETRPNKKTKSFGDCNLMNPCRTVSSDFFYGPWSFKIISSRPNVQRSTPWYNCRLICYKNLWYNCRLILCLLWYVDCTEQAQYEFILHFIIRPNRHDCRGSSQSHLLSMCICFAPCITGVLVLDLTWHLGKLKSLTNALFA